MLCVVFVCVLAFWVCTHGTSLFRFSALDEMGNGGWLEIRNGMIWDLVIGCLSQFYVVHLLTVNL